jgi:hypothetical protein
MFTQLPKDGSGSFRVVLALEEELRGDPLFWEMVSNRSHLLKVKSFSSAVDALEWYCANYSFAINSGTPGQAKITYEQFRETHGQE